MQRRLSIHPFLLAIVAAAGWLSLPGRAHAAGLLIADGGNGGVLEIKEHDVKVTINNGVAVTTVNQVFQNTEDRQVEALYTFPVPKGASVSNFSMWINGKEMVGEVLEKKKAREIYQSYKAVKRDPGLLEQVDYRTFEMRVFPIPPRAEQRVQVTYYQELDFDHNRAVYVYPLSTSTRPGVNARTSGKFALTLDVKSEIPITRLESPSHPNSFAIAKHAENYQQASLETRGGDLARDLVLAYETARPHTGVDFITSKPAGDDGYFLLTLTSGDELSAVADRPMDYVFLLDISGSMNDDQKLAVSRSSLESFISGLSEKDRFEIITFNVQPNTLFKSLMQADEASKKKAAEFLGSQQARGGTVLNPAITAAYRYASPERPLNVVILSDGLTEQGEQAELVRLIKQRPADSRVFAIGVGNDVNRGLLEQLAQDSGGLAAFLSRDDDLQKQAQAFRRKLLRPVASDVAIAIQGVQTYDLQPAKLPNLYHGMPVRLYGRYRGAGKAEVAVTAMVNGKQTRQPVELEFPKSDDANPQIERMWAMKKVDGLMKSAAAAGSRQSVADEVIRLGEAYSIVTEYTSFLVLENDAEFKRWNIDRRNLLRTERDRSAEQRVQQMLETMRQKAAADLGPAAVETMTVSTAAPAAGSTPGAQSPAQSRPRDVNFNSAPSAPFGSHGGGAIDPITGLAAIGFAGVAGIGWCVRRRERSPK